MKILFLTPWYPDSKAPHHGIFVREQACAVADRHKVVLISFKVDYERFSFFSFTVEKSSFENFEEYHIVVKRSMPFYNQINFLLIGVWFSVKIGLKFLPDIVHGNIGYPGAFLSYLTARLLKRPFIVTEHNSRFTNNFRSRFHKLLTIFSLNRANEIVSVSNHAANEVRRYVRARVTVVPNIVRVERFSVQPFSGAISQIGFIGALNSSIHSKGLDILIRALKDIDKNFVLHIAGDGRLRNYYESLTVSEGISSKCVFYGFLAYDEVPVFMNRLHFFVSSSRFESFGIAILEAMASGLPVIATESGGPADFVNESNGLIIPKENVNGLREAIFWMMNNFGRFDRLHIRRFVTDNFSRDAFRKRMDIIYNRYVSA